MKSYQKIALIGFGIEAKSAYEFLKNKNPNAIFDIYDQNSTSKVELPEGVNFFGGVLDFSEIKADLIVRTPAVRPDRLPSGVEVTSVSNLFFENCPAKIIGVTGTKGKGTTSSLIAAILRRAGKKVHLVGNIGLAALDVLPEVAADDIVVYEMSSFQLWDLKRSPNVAVSLMIEPDHLDVHADFEEYLEAKSQISRWQGGADFSIFNAKNESSKKVATAFLENGSEAPVVLSYGREGSNCFVEGDNFVFVDGDGDVQKICSTSAVKLPGAHNLENACAAILAAKSIMPEISSDVIAEGLGDFGGLPHRLKFVRNVDGVDFYDDSISTTPGSAIAALRSFSRGKVLILGGSDKGADLGELYSEIIGDPLLKKVVIFGAQANKIDGELRDRGFDRFENVGVQPVFKKVVQRAFESASDGDVVILSPAHASFDMFSSYSDRGEQFVEIVKNL